MLYDYLLMHAIHETAMRVFGSFNDTAAIQIVGTNQYAGFVDAENVDL